MKAATVFNVFIQRNKMFFPQKLKKKIGSILNQMDGGSLELVKNFYGITLMILTVALNLYKRKRH